MFTYKGMDRQAHGPGHFILWYVLRFLSVVNFGLWKSSMILDVMVSQALEGVISSLYLLSNIVRPQAVVKYKL
jgi:hypothetical protein